MYAVVWEFEARRGREKAFEAAYGPRGAWVRLFRRHRGFLRSDLLRDPARRGRYLTVDLWRNRTAYEGFLRAAAEAYHTLDAECAALTRAERLVGRFETPSP